jgi:hypothetical protein
MRGKLIKAKVIKELGFLSHIIKLNDEVHIQSILLDEPRLIHGEIGARCDADGKITDLISNIRNHKDFIGKKMHDIIDLKNGGFATIISEAVYAPIGSYDRCVIIAPCGREISGSYTRPYLLEQLFEKI